MPFVEDLSHMLAAFAEQQKGDFKQRLEQQREHREDIVLGNNLKIYGSGLMEARAQFKGRSLELLSKSFLLLIFQAVKKHPKFTEVVAVEFGDGNVFLSDGQCVDKATVLGSGQVFTSEDIRNYVQISNGSAAINKTTD